MTKEEDYHSVGGVDFKALFESVIKSRRRLESGPIFRELWVVLAFSRKKVG